MTTENGGELEMDTAAIRFLESINDRPWRGEPNDEDIARAQQLLRGAVTMRRASKSAFASLQSVDKSELSEEDKNCCICYNEFGVTNAEGISEAPLRLPKCKHIFGDYCIKKWFEEKDTCPYCRDKVPSERYVWPGEGIPSFLREAPPNVIIGLLGAGEPREVTSGSSRRSPPEDPAEGSRRRIRPRYSSMRGPPSGRHQSTQTGIPGGLNHVRPRHNHNHGGFNPGRVPHLPPSALAAGPQPATLPPFPHQAPTTSQWPTQPAQGLPEQGLPGFHQFVNPYPTSTSEGPSYNRPFPALGPPEFMMPGPNDPTPPNHMHIPGPNMSWGPHSSS